MSLVARALEEKGIATLIIGSALDVVEHCGVPRFLFTDFPLGNPCGKPWDRSMQRRIVEMGLELLEQAAAPRSTRKAPFEWGDESWRDRYMLVSEANRAALRAEGERRKQAQALAKGAGQSGQISLTRGK